MIKYVNCINILGRFYQNKKILMQVEIDMPTLDHPD